MQQKLGSSSREDELGGEGSNMVKPGQTGPGIATMAKLGPMAPEAAKSPDKSFPNTCTRFLSIQIGPQAMCWVALDLSLSFMWW